MNRLEHQFNIIEFTPAEEQYIPASMEIEEWMPENTIHHTAVNIPLGHSRYGGCVIDLPNGVNHPEGLRFAAQLDLAKFSPHDKTGLLPKSGQLYFFADILTDTGKVIYADVKNEELGRHIVEHDNNFYTGVLVDKIFPATETMEHRFTEEEAVDDDGNDIYINEWDYFAGTEKSKIFGIYTHCQYSQEEIEEITFSDKVLLLQVGENGFNDEGVFSVSISKEDLKNLNFDNCEFAWGQS